MEKAWAFFEGIPHRVVLDNFSAAVDKADNYDPLLNRVLAEYSQFRAFILDPARVRHPKDKPHTERGVPYVRERLYKGGLFRDIDDANRQAEAWCREIAGQRIHGTTRRKPLAVFEAIEQSALLSWDGVPYDVPVRGTAKVAQDYHSSSSEPCTPSPSATVVGGSRSAAIATSCVSSRRLRSSAD